MQLLALCAATHSFLPFISLCSGIVGTAEVRPADMLGSKFSGTHFGECSVIRVVRDET
jgi:hypothetical protein